MSDQIDLTSFGDRELWVVRGNGWTIPVFCDPFSADGERASHFRVSAAVVLDKEMADALAGILQPHNLHETRTTFVLAIESFSQLAEKAPGITPRRYLRWRGKSLDDHMEHERASGNIDPGSEAIEFCRRVVERTQIVSLPTMKLLYRAMCQELERWMIEDKRGIDLGVVKLFPVPYRGNWKQIMLAMFPHVGKVFRNARRDTLSEVLTGIGFLPNLFNSILCCINRKSHYLYWGVEAVPMDTWWEAVGLHEQKRYVAIGPVRYAEYWRKQVKQSLPRIIDAFRRWVVWNTYPCAEVDNSRIYSGPVLIPRRANGRVMPMAPPQGDVHPVVDADFAQLKGPEGCRPILPKATDLLEVPDLQQDARNLRLAIGNRPRLALPEPQDG